jgi:hypothetical protein
MATFLENLIARRDEVAQNLADLSAEGLDKPDSSGAPINVARIAYKDSLYRELRDLNTQISRADAFEVTSEMTA